MATKANQTWNLNELETFFKLENPYKIRWKNTPFLPLILGRVVEARIQDGCPDIPLSSSSGGILIRSQTKGHTVSPQVSSVSAPGSHPGGALTENL